MSPRGPAWLPVLVISGLTAGGGPAESSDGAARPNSPPTAVSAVSDTLHGTVLVDPYRWLEDGTSPAVQSWTDAQSAFTQQWLERDPDRAAIRTALERVFSTNVVISATPYGKRLFVQRKEHAKNHAVVVVHDADAKPPVRVTLDPNEFSADGTVALDWWYPNRDGALVAYGKSEGGSEMSTLFVHDVRTGQDLSDVIPNTQHASVAWDPDARSFLYTRHPAKGQVPEGEEVFHDEIFRHRLGDDPAKDVVAWDGKGAAIQEFRSIGSSSDGAWHFLTTSLDWAKNDLYARRAGSDDAFVPIAKGLDGSVSGDAWQGRFILRTNVGAPRYRIVEAVPGDTEASHWKTVVPELEGVIQAFEIVNGRLVLHVLENAHSRVLIYDMAGRRQREIELPALGTVSSLAGDPMRGPLYFAFTGFTSPVMTYRCDVATGAIEPLEQRDLPFDPAAYETEQVWATSKDGTRVPIFLVQKRGTPRDGERPTRLYGYGGFNVSETPVFRSAILPWLDRGGIYASAVLRGGGEFGRAWHQAGRLEHKQNTFDDYYAAAEWLIANRITRSAKLACEGGSNGGLLVGAAITQRPELWGAALCEVPLLDMIRYQRFSIARYWVPEYGSSEDAEQFKVLRAYSPYQNVRSGVRYPATLLMAGVFDSRVDPLHARKMAALMQAQDGGPGPILLRVEGRAGHGQGKPTAKQIESALDKMSFLDLALGIQAVTLRP